MLFIVATFIFWRRRFALWLVIVLCLIIMERSIFGRKLELISLTSSLGKSGRLSHFFKVFCCLLIIKVGVSSAWSSRHIGGIPAETIRVVIVQWDRAHSLRRKRTRVARFQTGPGREKRKVRPFFQTQGEGAIPTPNPSLCALAAAWAWWRAKWAHNVIGSWHRLNFETERYIMKKRKFTPSCLIAGNRVQKFRFRLNCFRKFFD